MFKNTLVTNVNCWRSLVDKLCHGHTDSKHSITDCLPLISHYDWLTAGWTMKHHLIIIYFKWAPTLHMLSLLLTGHSLCSPVLAGGFQQPCLRPVWDKEAVVVGEARVVLHARSSLSIFLKQLGNDIHGLLGRISPLKAKPGKLHRHRCMSLKYSYCDLLIIAIILFLCLSWYITPSGLNIWQK